MTEADIVERWAKPYSFGARVSAAFGAQSAHTAWWLGRRLRLARPITDSHLDVPVPDSDLARGAEDLLAAVAPPALVNHSYRSYLFASLLARRRRWTIDSESLYVSALLHDIGLVEKFQGPEPFQLIGAREAETLLAEWGAPEVSAYRVARVIALHLEPPAAHDDTRELAALHMGTAVDTIGLRRDEIDPACVRAVLQSYPWHGLHSYLYDTMKAEARAKPGCTTAFLFRWAQFGWRLRRSPLRRLAGG